MDLYFISGLGVDKRVFQKLSLPSDFSIHHIEWIKPLEKESVASYAKRLSANIDQSQPFVLIGLSFGGMIAVEMNQYLKPLKTIIISSASNFMELPWHVRFMRFLPVQNLLSPTLLKKSNPLYFWLFGIKTSEEKNLLSKILKETDNAILKWSIHAITNWRNREVPPNLVHIHGKQDKLLPIKFSKVDIEVEGGGHFMVFSKAVEISAILNDLLLSLLSGTNASPGAA